MNHHPSWNPFFEKHKNNIEIHDGAEESNIYPAKEFIFRVFTMDVKDIRVVFLGQDPYHGEGQAHGLSFSVPTGMPVPPSLQNIFKEINAEFPERNYDYSNKHNGNLERWFSEEKIFLVNAALTVEKNRPQSHMKRWTDFTNDMLQFISEQNDHCVFLLLGNFAKAKAKYITRPNSIIYGIHPSPLSAYRGFFGSNIFMQIEERLGEPVDWKI